MVPVIAMWPTARIGEGVVHALIFAVLKGVVEDLNVGGRGDFVNAEGDGDELAGLEVGGGGFDGFGLGARLCESSEKKAPNAKNQSQA